jgi:hypothetical protein
MLFGNGLSALMTLMAISATFVTLFVVGPLALSAGEPRGGGWPVWLAYFGMLGAGFMLIEVALLQRFVLLLGHPVYSLTVTLFSVLLGTGLGSLVSRRIEDVRLRRTTVVVLLGVVAVAILATSDCPPSFDGYQRQSPGADRVDGAAHRAGRRPDGHAPAGRDPADDAKSFSPRTLGLGHERRALGHRRNAGRVHRDELGVFGDARHRRGHLPRRRCTSAHFCR